LRPEDNIKYCCQRQSSSIFQWLGNEEAEGELLRHWGVALVVDTDRELFKKCIVRTLGVIAVDTSG
jgi:hypothetical protein